MCPSRRAEGSLQLREPMPWDEENYPDSMKGLEPDVRRKAIDIANALVQDEGYEEGRAIPIAQAQAKRAVGGAGGHGSQRGPGGQSGGQQRGPPQHVVPHPEGWAVRKEDAKQATRTFGTKQEAEDRARELAEKQNTDLVLHDAEGEEDKRVNLT